MYYIILGLVLHIIVVGYVATAQIGYKQLHNRVYQSILVVQMSTILVSM